MKKYFILSLATLFFVSCQNSKSEMVNADKDVVTGQIGYMPKFYSIAFGFKK